MERGHTFVWHYLFCPFTSLNETIRLTADTSSRIVLTLLHDSALKDVNIGTLTVSISDLMAMSSNGEGTENILCKTSTLTYFRSPHYPVFAWQFQERGSVFAGRTDWCERCPHGRDEKSRRGYQTGTTFDQPFVKSQHFGYNVSDPITWLVRGNRESRRQAGLYQTRGRWFRSSKFF